MAREVGHLDVTEFHVVSSMHERKAMMADLSDGFVALPGGFGTIEEIIEIATWAQLGLHAKPFGLLNVAGFYDPLVAFFDHAVAEGFLRPQHRATLLVAERAGRVARRVRDLAAACRPQVDRPRRNLNRGASMLAV